MIYYVIIDISWEWVRYCSLIWAWERCWAQMWLSYLPPPSHSSPCCCIPLHACIELNYNSCIICIDFCVQSQAALLFLLKNWFKVTSTKPPRLVVLLSHNVKIGIKGMENMISADREIWPELQFSFSWV